MLNKVLSDYKQKLKDNMLIKLLVTILFGLGYLYGYSKNYSVVSIFPYICILSIYDIFAMKNNKLFYIIPLNLNERRKYYEITFWINLIIPESIVILLGLALVILGNLELKFFIFISISLGMYIICKNLDIREYLKDNIKFYWDEFYWYGISMKASEFLFFVSLIYTIGYSINGEYYKFVNLCILALLFLQLWMLKSILGYREKIIEFIINPS